MTLYEGKEPLSKQIKITEYTEVSELMKAMSTEVGDIGQVLLPLNEAENKRRYLNGQSILQDQFPTFTEKLKKAVAEYPNLACTEEEWQTQKNADPDGQCGKFVIDDTYGTIRLPRIKYFVGSLDIYKISDGIPHRRLVKSKKPTDSDPLWYNIYSDGWCEQGNRYSGVSNAETTYLFEYPYLSTPHVVLGRYNAARNSVATNTDFMGKWSCSPTGFHTWGTWNGFSLEFIAYGYISLPSNLVQYTQGIQNQFEAPYYIQVSTGAEYNVDVRNELTINCPYTFGFMQRTASPLAPNSSWLEADGGFHSGDVYVDFYNWLLEKRAEQMVEMRIWRNDAKTSWFWLDKNKAPEVGDVIYGYANPKRPVGNVQAVNEDGSITIVNHGNAQHNDEVGTYRDTGEDELILVKLYDKKDDPSVVLTTEVENAEKHIYSTDYDFIINTEERTFRLPILNGDESVMSDEYTDISNQHWLTASAKTAFTATHNGFLLATAQSTAANQYICCYDDTLMKHHIEHVATASYFMSLGVIPMHRGQKLKDIRANFVPTTKSIRFIKAKSGMAHTYYYVGETLQNANLINIARMQEKFSDMETKISLLEAKPHVIETWSDGPSWYRIYSDGWCEQGGSCHDYSRADGYNVNNGGAYNVDVNLYIPYSTKYYHISFTTFYANPDWGNNPLVDGTMNNATSQRPDYFSYHDGYGYGSNWKTEGWIDLANYKRKT